MLHVIPLALGGRKDWSMREGGEEREGGRLRLARGQVGRDQGDNSWGGLASF